MTKLRKGEDVSMEAPRKICICLGRNSGDIVEFADEKSALWYIQYDMITMSLGDRLGWRSEWKNQMVPSRTQPKLGRYIYSTTLTDHPRYSPRLVHHGDDLSLMVYPVQRLVNGGSTPLVLRISVESEEPGDGVAIEHTDGGEIRNIRVHHMAWDREKMMDKTIQMEQGEFDYEK